LFAEAGSLSAKGKFENIIQINMKTRLQEKLAALIIEEMSMRLKEREKILDIIACFSDFPPERVTEEFLNEFEKLLESGLREEIYNRLASEAQPPPEISVAAVLISEVQTEVVEQITEEPITSEIVSVEEGKEEISETLTESLPEDQKIIADTEIKLSEPTVEIPSEAEEVEQLATSMPVFTEPRLETERPSIYFSKEKKTDIIIDSQDWIYLYGFSYAPNSEGKGLPSIELDIDSINKPNKIFGLDYGDVRIFMSKINIDDYVTITTGEPVLKSQEAINLKLQHAYILNQLRSADIIVPLDFWSIKKGRESIVNVVEEKYITFLHALIDVHDVIDWDVDVSVVDEHVLKVLAIDSRPKTIDLRRDGRHQKSPRINIKDVEKVLFKEKEIAYQINTSLTHAATKIKIDHMVSIDGSFLDGWKPILSARYIIAREKRKAFHQIILELQERYKQFNVMISVGSQKLRFKFQ
jgi:hypothetical protein